MDSTQSTLGVSLTSLPDEMILYLLKFLPLKDILNLEQTNSNFKTLSISPKGELVWHDKLLSRFPKALEYQSLSMSSRNYYVDLAKTFTQLGFDPNDPNLTSISGRVLKILFEDENTFGYTNTIMTRSGDTPTYIVKKIDMTENPDVSKYVLSLLIGNDQDSNDKIHYLWRKLPLIDDKAILSMWLYQTYGVQPTSFPRIDRSTGLPLTSYDNPIDTNFVEKVSLDELRYYLSIYDRSRLKLDLEKIVYVIGPRMQRGRPPNYSRISQEKKDLLVNVYNSL